ncbi:MAG: O-antigen ligase family protein [Flavobacteriales bacterium]|nr:O-antigen ligase family protein [Flavobacteriales bacterium]
MNDRISTRARSPLFAGLATLLALSIPLSIKLYAVPWNLELITPAEPLIALLLVIALYGSVFGGWHAATYRLQGSIPRTVAFWLCCGWIAAFFSSMPWVSLKAMLVRTAYASVFFVVPLLFGDARGIRNMLRFALLALVPAMGLSFYRQFRTGVERATAIHAAFPFFADHTIYSAALVFALLGVLAWAVWARGSGAPEWKSTALVLGGAVLAIACYATFSRAGWLSIFVSVGMAVGLLLGMRWKGLLVAAGVALPLVLSLAFRAQHAPLLGPHDANSDHAGWKETLLSVPNLTTDASNKERLNRWFCAARMFRARPWWGFGPGTYQFQYIPFQQASELTYLSWVETTDLTTLNPAWSLGGHVMVKSSHQLHYYSGGTAHSEYLLAFAEGGLFSGVVFILLLALGIREALLSIDRAEELTTKWTLVACSLALVAYSVHGAFNNYLDDCKVAYPFWTCLALITIHVQDIRNGLPPAGPVQPENPADPGHGGADRP